MKEIKFFSSIYVQEDIFIIFENGFQIKTRTIVISNIIGITDHSGYIGLDKSLNKILFGTTKLSIGHQMTSDWCSLIHTCTELSVVVKIEITINEIAVMHTHKAVDITFKIIFILVAIIHFIPTTIAIYRKNKPIVNTKIYGIKSIEKIPPFRSINTNAPTLAKRDHIKNINPSANILAKDTILSLNFK